MSAQHLTHPHSAEKIEATHHLESSEGHQVPGPPHSHGHDDHHDTSSGPVIAMIALVLLLGGAAAIGVRTPEVSQPTRHGAGPAFEPSGALGVVVLKDGREFPGRLVEREGSYLVHTAEGEVVLPKALVDEVQRGSTARPVERGGGIVVTTTGEVFVGRVSQEERGVSVSWPYGPHKFKGEVTIPRDRVRYWTDKRDTLGDDYWSQHGDAPIEAGWQRGGTSNQARPPVLPAGREGAARPGPRDRRSEAQVAQTQSRWEEGAAAWAQVYSETKLASDLKNLLVCTHQMLAHGFESDEPRMQRAHELLTPFAQLPVVRDELANAYVNAVGYHLTRKQVPLARRWALALESLGGKYAEAAKSCLQAAAKVEHDIEEEEAEEHEEHGH